MLRRLSLFLCVALACATGRDLGGSPDGGGTSTGSGGAGGADAGDAGGAAGAGAGGAVGAGGAGGAGGGMAGAGGRAGAGGSIDGGGADSGGGVGGAAGAAVCAGRAVSLGANGTGTDSDAARARVVINLGTDLPIGNAQRTVEFWAFIKTTDWMGERNEVYVYGTQGTTTAFGLDFGTNPVVGMAGNHATLNPYTNGGFNDDSTNYLGITSTMNQWVHIAMTWDGTAVRTYVNGTVRITTMGTGGVTMLATASTPLTMGCNDPIFNCFNGMFDELRAWNVARTATQIMGSYNKSLAGNEAGLVGYWKFDEAPGATTVADSVTTAGHTAHPGTLMAVSPAQIPTLITPTPPVPLVCP